MYWFDVKVSYEKMTTDNKEKKVSEQYLVACETFTDAEEFVSKHLDIRKPFMVNALKRVRLYDLVFDHKGDYFYLCKVAYITLDENSGAEKRKSVQILVQANSCSVALDTLQKRLNEDVMGDTEVEMIKKTSYIEVFE